MVDMDIHRILLFSILMRAKTCSLSTIMNVIGWKFKYYIIIVASTGTGAIDKYTATLSLSLST